MKKSILVVTIILLLSLVATTSASAGIGRRLPTWEQVLYGEGTSAGVGVEFKGRLYFTYYGAGPEDQVWGTKDGENWSMAWQASDIIEGYESIWNMFVFKNQLYLVLSDWAEEYPTLLMRTPDGKQWEVVSSEEWPGDPSGSVSFKGAIYLPLWDYTSTVFLVRSTSGDQGTWEEVEQFPGWQPWFAPVSFTIFKGALYVISDYIVVEGEFYGPAEIWRSYDGLNWEPVMVDGFGDETNIRGGSFGQMGGYLYASAGEAEDASDIYRTRDGVNWEPVTTDGFGDPTIVVFSSFVTYRNQIIAYGASWEGCRVYASRDGRHWQMINEPGWGDSANAGVLREYGRVIFKGNLYTAAMGPGGVYKLVNP